MNKKIEKLKFNRKLNKLEKTMKNQEKIIKETLKNLDEIDKKNNWKEVKLDK